MEYSIVIPMYNEVRNLNAAVSSLRGLLDRFPQNAEVLLVNDGSTDRTRAMAEELTAGDDRFVVTGYEKNRGKGAADRFGMMAAHGKILLLTDCDLAYGCDTMYEMMTSLEKDASTDLLIGSRNLSSDGYSSYTPLRRLMSKAYIQLIKLVAGFHFSDSQCGIKCFRAEAAHRIFPLCEVERFAIDLEILLLAEHLGYTVREYPVSVMTHDQGSSKVNPVKDTLQMLGDLKTIKKRVRRIDPSAQGEN